MRVYALTAGDRFTISENGIEKITSGEGTSATTTALAKGQLVLVDGYDLVAAAAGTNVSSKAFVGEIIEEIQRTNGKFYKVLVRKNG
jgi:hypothetical protein